MKFKVKANFKPTGDQPQAIVRLVQGLRSGMTHQVLLGVTGSGKTFTMAKVIEKIQKPTLIISHNKTLAAQLYQEFRDFFPGNAVSYFVSYYDYYQPEAYLPQTDTYIEKEIDINQDIDRLRLHATNCLLNRQDVIIVASVSCIYNLGSPEAYTRSSVELKKGDQWNRKDLLKKLVSIYYARSDNDFIRGTFRVRGEILDIFPADSDQAVRLMFDGEKINNLLILHPVSGRTENEINAISLYPAKHYVSDLSRQKEIFCDIKKDLKNQIAGFKKKGQLLEAHRLETRVNYDLEQIAEFGYVNGIENYSRYFDGRKPGEPPFTLLDYFPKDYLTIIDESHMTIPQIRGMFNGDQSRKETLIDYGFRLPAARDNRPLKFDEFLDRVNQIIYTSATPDIWELKKARQSARLFDYQADYNGVTSQLVRPTGIIDPEIEIRPTKGQIDDLISEISKRIVRSQRILVTTLTKRMAEELSNFLKERQIKVHHLHSEINTLDRSDILDDLRLGKYDVIVGINLLREGLDLPEVSLVVILDADKEGFLRSETSLIQVMGRAARHVEGQVIMYADQITGSMERAISEIKRRRRYQLIYNRKHNIDPRTIQKPVRKKLIKRVNEEKNRILRRRKVYSMLDVIDPAQLIPAGRKEIVKDLKRKMRQAAAELEFELAAEIRDKIMLIETFG
ncbi:MAG TPA: excinuclease ABC subunit UvrB [Candidatus Bathyarchaeia archaeon]|nr:excinuclease ABC subunit UvrB [Candidatus Bathyarchaeia archaeon]